MEKSEILWRGIWGLDYPDLTGPQSGGIVIFHRNLDSDPEAGPGRLFSFIKDIQDGWGRTCPICPIAVAIDQEGGRVSRLKAWTGETPSLRQIWLKGGANACGSWGQIWGKGLGLLGISVDFAPVSDLYDEREDTGLGCRCASEYPEEVILAAGAFLDGLESTGVHGCLKHFPGLGGTQVDSHYAMPSIEDQSVIEKNLLPFLRLANQDRLIMVAHLQTPGSNGLPASLHRGYAAGNPWGVEGRWIPDDMEMKGCQAPDWQTRARLALEAGHQALLVCQTPEEVQRAKDAAESLDDSLIAPAIESFRSLRRALRPMPDSFDKAAWGCWIGDVKRESKKFL